ncbi:MAG: zinc ribbon domain-containing protein, partial [Halobacteria archaeon]|nr:zinc ribbon domain-containing protein [Halobacteria archaeon]
KGIDVERVDEKTIKSSQTCSSCGETAESHRVERGLYVCDNCELVANADCNGAENIRQELDKVEPKVTSSPSTSRSVSEGVTTETDGGEDRGNGCLAQPEVILYDRTCGFLPQQSVV